MQRGSLACVASRAQGHMTAPVVTPQPVCPLACLRSGRRRCGTVAARAVAAPAPTNTDPRDAELRALDDKLSWRPLQLDPAGYYIIKLDREAREIVAEHYSNNINDKGLAVDDETGEVIGCRKSNAVRLPRRVFRGRTAKELSVRILEQEQEQELGQSGQQQQQEQEQAAGSAPAPGQVQGALPWISRLEHANYLGREFVRAELALLSGTDYVQD
ncbi:hypothetical protein HYH02_009967 [Chlamydomonas schloesseri]|uniref:DUF4346 domain-containing protein n=1 Tax=Chlamydomonas schloesseri TaxID=2026947 RepID=A0A835TC68_9CHLO|nr:hypothetical protein HYH02_009967 [Chlamydomonas schloesseri]|eukprot:KAG2441376.1 hypothetical protein HYH02_009967 [Chlamydomonas schloesseri]